MGGVGRAAGGGGGAGVGGGGEEEEEEEIVLLVLVLALRGKVEVAVALLETVLTFLVGGQLLLGMMLRLGGPKIPDQTISFLVMEV